MTKKTDPARRIDYVPLDDLTADPRNPKAHRLDVLDESLGRFGYVEPVVVDERTGFLVAGHGRTSTLRSMRERGESPPEGVSVDEDGSWLVPAVVGWASRTDSEAAAALIALNRTTEVGGWVDDALLGLLDNLATEDVGLDGIGYDEDALDALRRVVDAESFGKPTDPDEEWVGMPEFEQEDLEPHDKVNISFPDEEAVVAFFDLLGVGRKRRMWWPETDGHVGSDTKARWVAEDEDEDL